MNDTMDDFSKDGSMDKADNQPITISENNKTRHQQNGNKLSQANNEQNARNMDDGSNTVGAKDNIVNSSGDNNTKDTPSTDNTKDASSTDNTKDASSTDSTKDASSTDSTKDASSTDNSKTKGKRKVYDSNTVIEFEVAEVESKEQRNDDIEKSLCPRLERCFHKVSPRRGLISIRLKLDSVFSHHKTLLKRVLRILLFVGYIAYFTYAMRYHFGDEGSGRLLVITILVLFGYTVHTLRKTVGVRLLAHLRDRRKIHQPNKRMRSIIKICLTVALVTGITIFTIYDVFLDQPYNLVPAMGIIVFIFTMFFFSHEPNMVTWRPVLWGLLLQFVFAIIVLRTQWGYTAFDWIGKRVVEYLDHTDYGAKFLFGDTFTDHYFAFKVLPVIFFFSATISMLYYLGWMQVIIEKIAFIMQYSLGTTALESLHASINVFVGWGETTTLIRPFFNQLTLSELHTIMTNGFATVAGSTLVIYTLYGAPANHLISASVMSAPAALSVSKLFWPEKKRDKKEIKETLKSYRIKREGYNLVDAASAGAITALPIVAYILASVIVFFSLLDFLNSTLTWFGDRVGLIEPNYPRLTFQLICSYLFWPLVFLMGVEYKDCMVVARFVGIKTCINEFLAFEDLGNVITNRETLAKHNGSWHFDNSYNIKLNGTNTTLYGGVISKRSEVISTYALCGFANVTALGIMIGALTAVAPSRKKDIVRVSTRALISGCMACFITACIAGILS